MSKVARDTNIVLIGMPGAGKSTVGVLLAKATEREFLDTDVFIQVRQGRPLQEIVDSEGLRGFCRIEERCVLELFREHAPRRHVIATGGSVVYSNDAMAALRQGGMIVHLDLPLALLEQRLGNLATRGVVIAEGHSLAGLYEERRPLYQAWADMTIDCTGKNQDQIVAEIVATVIRQ